MALADYLSAIRVLILDEGMDGPVAQRRALLARRFPRLTEAEISDLGNIPPQRLLVYTDLVFAGMRSTLEYVFPVSLAVIHRLRTLLGDDRPPRLADFELVRELHRWRTWNSDSQRELAANFEAFVRDKHQPWLAAWPGLAELLDFERTELEVFYAEDPPHSAVSEARLAGMAAMTVEALMSLKVVAPAYIALRSYAFDIPATVTRWRRESTLPVPLPAPKDCRVVCGRDVNTLLPVWHELNDARYAALEILSHGYPLTINDLADGYLSAVSESPSESEEERFADFFGLLQLAFRSGILLLPDTA